jgi:hypothetical protein
VPPDCIVLANIVVDFVVGQPSFFERTRGCRQSLCDVPSGASPSLKPQRVASRRPHRGRPAFVVHHFAIGDISPVSAHGLMRFIVKRRQD